MTHATTERIKTTTQTVMMIMFLVAEVSSSGTSTIRADSSTSSILAGSKGSY